MKNKNTAHKAKKVSENTGLYNLEHFLDNYWELADLRIPRPIIHSDYIMEYDKKIVIEPVKLEIEKRFPEMCETVTPMVKYFEFYEKAMKKKLKGKNPNVIYR